MNQLTAVLEYSIAMTGSTPPLQNLSISETAVPQSQEQKVTPFTVAGAVDKDGKILPVDYNKLTRDFGATPLSQDMIDRFERVTGRRAHRYMRRGMVISHRELGRILDHYEQGKPIFLYTGRGPSSDSMHIGHATPFEFTKYLQDTFDCPLVIMLTDDEKFLYNQDATIEGVEKYMKENAKDIIGLGFDPAKTFMFSDIEFMGGAFYKNILRLEKRITVNSSKATFGHTDSSNIGLVRFVATQAATSYATSFPHIFGPDEKKTAKIPCLIPCAIDQDPYFRQCREHAEKLKYQKPSLIHSVFLPALQGPGSKMSASDATSAVFLSDTPKQIQNKINKYAFSGGQDTLEKHREFGGRTEVDVPFQYLKFFMEDDDELERIRIAYEKGELLTGELKKICVQHLQEYVSAFQERRKEVDEKVRVEFMSPRPLVYKGNPNPRSKEEIEAAKSQILQNAKDQDIIPASDGKNKDSSVAPIAEDVRHRPAEPVGVMAIDGAGNVPKEKTAPMQEDPVESTPTTPQSPENGVTHLRKGSKVKDMKNTLEKATAGHTSPNGSSRQPSKRLSRGG